LLRSATSDFIFFLNDLDPDGCLVADQLKVQTKILESTGADNKKGLLLNWVLTLQKKDIIFCVGEVFSLDRGLLMGANIASIQDSNLFADIINDGCQVKSVLSQIKLTTSFDNLKHVPSPSLSRRCN